METERRDLQISHLPPELVYLALQVFNEVVLVAAVPEKLWTLRSYRACHTPGRLHTCLPNPPAGSIAEAAALPFGASSTPTPNVPTVAEKTGVAP